MNTNDATPAADRGSECNALLGLAVPGSVLAYLHAYGDSRADEDGRSGLRIGEAVLALRRWAAELQAAERERCAKLCDTHRRSWPMDGPATADTIQAAIRRA